MNSEIIRKYLEELKEGGECDSDFVNILQQCNEKNEDGEEVAEKLISVIRKRYVESK